MFTENRNTEDGIDESFLNINECLTGEVIESTDLITNSNHKCQEMDDDLAQIESIFGTSNVQISNTCMDLLNQFESEVYTKNSTYV